MSIQIRIYGQQVLTFEEDALVRVRLQQRVDLNGGGLPEQMLEVQLRSLTPLQLQNEQKLELYYDQQLQATAWVMECTRLGQTLYRLRGRQQLEHLQTEFKGAMYEGESLGQLLDGLLEGRPYEIEDVLSLEPVYGLLPRGNRQEAVRQLTAGSGAVIGLSKKGCLRFYRPDEHDPTPLKAGRILGEYTLQLLPEYTRFELAAHSYTKGQFPVKLKDRVEYPSGQTVLYFSTPYFNYYADGELAIYVSEEGPNYAVVEHKGLITLYAYPYLHETTYHTLPGAADTDYSLVQTVRDVTLVHGDNVEALLGRMQAMGQLRIKAVVRYAVAPKEELLRAGDPVELPTAWGTILRGFVQKSDLLAEHDTLKLELTIVCKEETE